MPASYTHLIKYVMKRLIFGLALGLCTLLLIACSDGKTGNTPSESYAEKEFANWFEDNFGKYLSITSFEKTNGQWREVDGVEYYTLVFEGTISFKSHCYWNPNDDFGVAPFAAAVTQRAMAGSDAVGPTAQRLRDFTPAFAGDTVSLSGELNFEKNEAGWDLSENGVSFLSVPDYEEYARQALDELKNYPSDEESSRLARELGERVENLISLLQEGEGEEFMNTAFLPHIVDAMKRDGEFEEATQAMSTETRYRGELLSSLEAVQRMDEPTYLLKGGDIADFRVGEKSSPVIFVKENGEWYLSL